MLAKHADQVRRPLSLITLTSLVIAILLMTVPGGSNTASADHNEFPNDEFCDVVFEFIGAVCPDEFHGAFTGDFVNADELGPNCSIPTFLFEPFLDPDQVLWTFGHSIVTPNGKMLLSCSFDVPEELIVNEIPRAQVTKGGICFGPLGPTHRTNLVLTPSGKIKLSCHFDYGD